MSTYRPLGPAELVNASWRKSAHSGNTGACVEVADLTSGHHAIRDSKNPASPALIVTSHQWTAFTTGIRNGELT